LAVFKAFTSSAVVLTLSVAAYPGPEAVSIISRPVKRTACFKFITFLSTDSSFKKPLVLSGFIIFAYSPLFINAGFSDVRYPASYFIISSGNLLVNTASQVIANAVPLLLFPAGYLITI
jgi:hypothetical protein